MIYAHTNQGPHQPASQTGDRGTCPTCTADVLAKCGHLVTHHWAHINNADCDTWSEPITAWHLAWQQHAPPERREVTIGDHRADIIAADGHVVEVQHSHLNVTDIAAREAHYGPTMVWIWDARDAYEEDRLLLRQPRPKDPYRTFRWKHPRKSIAACRGLVLLDYGAQHLLRVSRLYPEAPCGGWGHIVPVSQVTSWIAGSEGADQHGSHLVVRSGGARVSR